MSPFQYDYQAQAPKPEPAKPDPTSQENPRGSRLKRFAKYFLLFIVVFIILYIGLSFPALWAKVKYYYQTDILHQDYQGSSVVTSGLPSPYTFSIPSTEMPTTNDVDKSSTSKKTVKKQVDEVQIPNNSLFVPKLDIKAPIRWDIPSGNAMDQLREGVVHIKQTSFPGQVGGNVFLTGHSSYYWWDSGKYKFIFTLLPQIKKDTKVYVKHHDTLYTYKVYQTLTVKPDDTWVMKQIKGKNIVSLMTCVPIGTSLRRFVVRAEQISPNPSTRETQKPAPIEQDIPADLLPGIFN